LTTEITKRMDIAWAIGDDAGGNDGTVLPVSGIYYVWLIKNPTTGNVDALGSTSPTAPTTPAGYTIKRLIGAWLTDASNNLIAGTHKGTIFTFLEPTEDVTDTTITDAVYETGTLSAPPDSIVRILGTAQYPGAGDDSLFLSIRPVGSTSTDHVIAVDLDDTSAGTPQADEVWTVVDIQTDSSSQIEYTAQDKTASDSYTINVTIKTLGFNMLTRNDP
jgi:hypothetical protein